MNRELWKQMSFSKKIGWIVQYYGATIVVVIISILVVVSLIKSIITGGDKGDMRVIILDNGVSSELCQVYQDEVSNLIEGDAEMTAYIKNDPTHMQAFSVRLTADDLDIVIAPKEEMQEMAENGYLLSYDINGITAFYNGFPLEKQLIVKTEANPEGAVWAIQLDHESRYMTYRRDAGAKEEEDMYLGVTIKKVNDHNIEKTALYLLEQ